MQLRVSGKLGLSGYYPVKVEFDKEGRAIYTDCDSLPPRSYLSETIKAVNRQHDILLALEIHLNNVANPERHGGLALYCDTSIKGKRYAELFAERLSVWLRPFEAAKWSTQGRNFKAGFLYRTIPPALILECGFMSNKKDNAKILSDWHTCADIIAETCEDVLNAPN